MKAGYCDHQWKWDKYGYGRCNTCNINRSKYRCVVCESEFFDGIRLILWGQPLNFCGWHCLEHFDADAYEDLKKKEDED